VNSLIEKTKMANQKKQASIAEVGEQLGVLETEHFELLKQKVVLETLIEIDDAQATLYQTRRIQIEAAIHELPKRRLALVQHYCNESLLMQSWFLTASLYTWRQHCVGYLLEYLIQPLNVKMARLRQQMTLLEKQPLASQTPLNLIRLRFRQSEHELLQSAPTIIREFYEKLFDVIFKNYAESFATMNRNLSVINASKITCRVIGKAGVDVQTMIPRELFSYLVSKNRAGSLTQILVNVSAYSSLELNYLQIYPFCESMVTMLTDVRPTDFFANQLYKYPQEERVFNWFKFSERQLSIRGHFKKQQNLPISDRIFVETRSRVTLLSTLNGVKLFNPLQMYGLLRALLERDVFDTTVIRVASFEDGETTTFWYGIPMIRHEHETLNFEWGSVERPLKLYDDVKVDEKEKENGRSFNKELWPHGLEINVMTRRHFVWVRIDTKSIPNIWNAFTEYKLHSYCIVLGTIYRASRANKNQWPPDNRNIWELVPTDQFRTLSKELFLFSVDVSPTEISILLLRPRVLYRAGVYECMETTIQRSYAIPTVDVNYVKHYLQPIVAALHSDKPLSGLSGHVNYISGTNVCAAIVLAPELQTSAGSVMVNLAKQWGNYFDVDFLDLVDAAKVPCKAENNVRISLRVLGFAKERQSWYNRFGFVLKNASAPALEFLDLLFRTPWHVFEPFVILLSKDDDYVLTDAIQLLREAKCNKNPSLCSNLTIEQFLLVSNQTCGIYKKLEDLISNTELLQYFLRDVLDGSVKEIPQAYISKVKQIVNFYGGSIEELVTNYTDLFKANGIWFRRSSFLQTWLKTSEDDTLSTNKAKHELVEEIPLQLTKDLI